ncbi:MAG: hypothetical protein EA411_00940 [Saprospirales bacterium]|nr:MAG: hypothetical protein EA411_00940 [Saprospirales bacterium]
MRHFFTIPGFSLLGVIALFLIACSPGEDFEPCEEHFDLAAWVEKETAHIKAGDIMAMKVIATGESGTADTVELSPAELVRYIEDLDEYNIDLPNLIGRYSCEEKTLDDGLLQWDFHAREDRLSVRHFVVTKDKSGEVTKLSAVKKVGSFMASMEKNFEWKSETKTLVIHVDYSSLFGTDKIYTIGFYY